jgi:hypothetical protein
MVFAGIAAAIRDSVLRDWSMSALLLLLLVVHAISFAATEVVKRHMRAQELVGQAYDKQNRQRRARLMRLNSRIHHEALNRVAYGAWHEDMSDLF